uniref:NADH:quinone oxidoreductase/Mrp antiporter transmembrane domain-containing protein n=1 Tax=Lactuca sativa TaxID=4236 RepID=A0A9R1V2B9_LACSA|nr:hypothetical protein LSAT_V11C700361000 [Lactuca sativa]
MSDKGLARNLFPVGPPSGGRPSMLPEPSGLPCIPLTGGSIPRVRSSPLSEPSGRPRNGFVSGAMSLPLPGPTCLPHNIFTGSSVSGCRPSLNLSGLQQNPFWLVQHREPSHRPTLMAFHASLCRVAFHALQLGRKGRDYQGNVGNDIAYGSSIRHVGYIRIGFLCGTIEGIQSLLIGIFIYASMTIDAFAIVEMTGNNEEPASDYFYNGPKHEHKLEHGHESVHEPESPMVLTPHYQGYKFGGQRIHRAILKIFWQSINEPWITYRKILKEVVTQMLERFRTQYRWDPNEEGRIREGFENTLKVRYRGRMKDVKDASVNSARKVGHVIAKINDNFEILANYNPVGIHRDVWRHLCRKWDTDEWKKLSKSRIKTITLILGGQPHIQVVALDLRSTKELTGEDPSFIDLYYKTHLTAESKRIYFGGDKEASMDFVNETSRESYNKVVSQKYGDDATQHNTQTQLLRKGEKQKGPIYGAGYSDLHFLMTGAYSYESTSASVDFAKSQQDRQLAAFMKQINPAGNQPK